MSKAPKVPGAAPAQPQPIPETAVPQPEGLPNYIDVDPKTITAPVLTRQGWVCPPDRPRQF
jgi:hypothetical protein